MTDILVEPESRPRGPWPISIRTTLAIFLISVLGLFLEMLIIRCIGTEVRIFGHLQNSILIAVLGLGLGCLTSKKSIDFRQTLIPVAFLLTLAIPFVRRGLAETGEFFGIGGLTGGLLQTLSFIASINPLLLMAAALYACSLLTRSNSAKNPQLGLYGSGGL
jgi:hypothetical protein